MSDPFVKLGSDVRLHILAFTDWKTLTRCSRINSDWQTLASHDRVWSFWVHKQQRNPTIDGSWKHEFAHSFRHWMDVANSRTRWSAWFGYKWWIPLAIFIYFYAWAVTLCWDQEYNLQHSTKVPIIMKEVSIVELESFNDDGDAEISYRVYPQFTYEGTSFSNVYCITSWGEELDDEDEANLLLEQLSHLTHGYQSPQGVFLLPQPLFYPYALGFLVVMVMVVIFNASTAFRVSWSTPVTDRIDHRTAVEIDSEVVWAHQLLDSRSIPSYAKFQLKLGVFLLFNFLGNCLLLHYIILLRFVESHYTYSPTNTIAQNPITSFIVLVIAQGLGCYPGIEAWRAYWHSRYISSTTILSERDSFLTRGQSEQLLVSHKLRRSTRISRITVLVNLYEIRQEADVLDGSRSQTQTVCRLVRSLVHPIALPPSLAASGQVSFACGNITIPESLNASTTHIRGYPRYHWILETLTESPEFPVHSEKVAILVV